MDEKKYQLRFLLLFSEDLNEIVEYISNDLSNPDAAYRFVEEVESSIVDRLRNPESFEAFHSKHERKLPYYRLQVKNFYVFNVVDDDVMEVRRIFYARANWKRIL